MKQYNVRVTAMYYGYIRVEAANADQALDDAMYMGDQEIESRRVSWVRDEFEIDWENGPYEV